MRKALFPQTLSEMLIAQKDNQDKGITFISAATKEEYLSYQQLYNSAVNLLGYLQEKGIKPGNEVVLQVDDNKTFIRFFWACIMGGIIPVPVAITYQGENAQKLFKIWQTLHHPFLLTSRAAYDKLGDKNDKSGLPFEDKILFTEDAEQRMSVGVIHPAKPDDIAFLQFSSGSTGNPKGVVLRHSNLVANTACTLPTHECEEDRRLSWMPLTHDLGLIFFHLYPIAIGAQHFLMPTDLFIRHPLLWMQKISEHRATITGSPNFGYKYYLNQFKEEKVTGLDLSSLQIIINGAEPISGALCRNFMDTLGKYNLRPSAMCPAYGLAESTLIVSFSEADALVQSIFVRREALTTGRDVTAPGMMEKERNADNMELVNVGPLIAETGMKITDEKGNPLKEGSIGILWINGPSVTREYYNNKTATNAVIKDGWLNTGDTGFMLDGHLYMVGRVKDIIIVNGLNVYPHDIEQTVEILDGIETGKVVACGVPNEDESSESIVIFVLFKLGIDKFVPLARAVKRVVAEQLGLEVKHVLPVRKISKTTSGKVKRYLFSDEYRNGAYNDNIAAIAAIEKEMMAQEMQQTEQLRRQAGRHQETAIRQWLENWLQQRLQLSAAELAQGRTFKEYGITSMQSVALAEELEIFLQTTVDNTVIYNFPNVRSLAAHLSGTGTTSPAEKSNIAKTSPATGEKIAIVGMGCRLPGNVSTPEAFWQLLLEEKNAITSVPADRWEADAWYDTTSGTRGKMYTREGGFINGAATFDPLFFGISPKEAEAMDPQQRLLLEVCWEALEHAGIRPSDLRGSDSGVFIGMGADDYQQLIRSSRDSSYYEDAFTGLGTERSIAAGRIAYLLDFHGPVMQLDTACSSSLVSIHQACQSLLYDNCSLALAGGVNLMLTPDGTVKLCQMQALSPTGSCKTFDDAADGYVRSEGAGIIVLKRLSDAIADGDNILAVISGTAVNHDGLSNGISAPNGQAQQQLINKALSNAGIPHDAVQYIEAHGTGTRLGDPVEVQALNAVYGRGRTAENPLILGAVKSNIGHLEAAAGVAGLIKTVLCLQHRQIPASLHQHNPNRFIPWQEMPVKVADRLMPWQPGSGIRRGAVSAFGLSGTNAHVILEEAAPVAAPATPAADKPAYPVLLSAKTPAALKALAARYATLPEHTAALRDLSYSTAVTREHFAYRLATGVSDSSAARQLLAAYAEGNPPKGLLTGQLPAAPEKTAWLFTGQGSQYWGMGRELYEHNEVFRGVIDHCDAWLKTQWDISLITLLYDNNKEEGNQLLRETKYTQPALYAIGCALAAVWKSWGIAPAVVAGHSVGEFAAAYVAGVFSLDDGLKLITERARLMHAITTPGSMAVVFAPENDIKQALVPYGKTLSVAAVNGPALTVISGEKAALAAVLADLKQNGIGSRELSVSHAFHSPLMEPVIAAFRQVAGSIRYQAPVLPLVSNVTGSIVTTEVTTAEYWCRHILAPVLFSASVQTIRNSGADLLLELGPQPNLLSMAQLTLSFEEGTLLPSMREGQSSWNTMLQVLMALHVRGIAVDWNTFYDNGSYRRVPLPVYPFQRQRYWIKEEVAGAVKAVASRAPAMVPVAPAAAVTPVTPAVPVTTAPVAEAPVAPVTITGAIINNLVETLSRLLKIAPSDINVHTPFISQGADSLILASVVRKVENEYGLSFSMRLLFEELTTIELIGAYIAKHATLLPEQVKAATAPQQEVTPAPAVQQTQTPAIQQPDVQQPAAAAIPPAEMPAYQPAANGIHQYPLNGVSVPVSNMPAATPEQSQLMQGQFGIMSQLIQLMSQQLQTMQPAGAVSSQPEVQQGQQAAPPFPVQQPVTPQVVSKHPVAVFPVKKSAPSIFPKMETQRMNAGLTPQQQAYLNAFIARYIQKTKTSRAITEQYRPKLADIRASAGFRFMTKEILYPIVGETSMGARMTDVDGNEYIDITMGFGVNLLGHRPDAVTAAVERQLEKGYQLGPQTRLAGQVAEKIATLTGMDRISFHNSGTEAVMSAMRMARALSGKPKIAIFLGSYHGYFDGTLAIAEDVERDHHGVPVATGIPDNMVADVLVFDYLNPNVVQQIRAHAHELAAVLVEPVQSRRPGYQPKAILQELRAMTAAEKIILIFDEMITGFRIHPGGAQAHFGVQADLVTYGKIIGGGFPIGVVAGREWCMRAVDGGVWNYGDDSYPQAETTFLAGTFCKHPVSMAAALAILEELERHGPALQQQLNTRTSRLVNNIAVILEQHQVPVKVQHFGSLFYFTVTGDMDLFFYHLIEKGIYIWEGRSCFLSAAHTDDDLRRIEQAFRDTIADLQQGGFLPGGGGNRLTQAATPVRRESTITAAIGTIPLPERIPLSFNQERLWFIDQLEGSIHYNLPIAVRIKGALDKDALTHALQQIVERHEVLRTVIRQDDGQPYQYIMDSSRWKLITTDGDRLHNDPAALQAYIVSQVYKPFDLAADNMLRANLIRLREEEHVLVLAVHHIVSDDWSVRMLFGELVAGYNAYVENRIPELPALKIQYKDYAIWQRHHLKGAFTEKQLAYWKQKLTGATPMLLPTDFERPVARSPRGAMSEMIINKTLSQQIHQLGRQHGVTLFTTLLSAFKVMLYRYSQLEDIIVACAIAGRTPQEVEPLLGFFANTLILRSDLSGAPSFAALLKQVSTTVLDAHDHQDVPVSAVVAAVNDQRSAGDNPLLHVMFTLQSIPQAGSMNLGSAQVAYEPVKRQASIADITWAVEDMPEGIALIIEYSTDLFTEATIARMMQHYQALLQAAVENPALPVNQLNMLEEEERKQLSLQHHGKTIVYPADKTVTELLEAQVTARPQAIAISDGDHAITYQTLNERAEQVGHYLIANGIKPGDHVGLLAYRGIDMIVAIWGILKSGAAYVPFNTDYPAARISLMMEDAGIGTILYTDQGLFDKTGFPATAGLSIQGAVAYPVTPTGIRTGSNTAVNVMFTSGTTGRPKGIAISHQNIVKLTADPGAIAIRADDRVLQWSNYAFDGSTYEIFCTLMAGAQLCLIPENSAADALELSAFIKKAGITISFMTTALFNNFVDTHIDGLRPLRKILFGGEKASLPHVQKALAALGAGRMANVYGPTETTVYATCFPIDHIPAEAFTVPIGRPLSNTSVQILDANGQPVPAGVDGELYIGGDGVAGGYLNNDTLTAEKFVTLPGSTGRWYRTGDICRWLPDGNIAYITRVDDQVKIRGYRIEPGEIEKVMNQLDEVYASCVVVKKHASGENRLVAYYVPAAHNEPDNIRTALLKKLPDYMVPFALIVLDELPRTSNGKTDRKALINREDVLVEQTAAYQEPVTPLEQQLAAIWQQLLGVERVGRKDTFFSLGGHSLLATRLVSAVRRELETEMSVKELFRYPSLEKLAGYLQQQQKGLTLPAVTVAERPEHIPLSYSQRRMWFIDQLGGGALYNMSAGFRLEGELDMAALEYAWQQIVERHEILRTVIVQGAEMVYQRILPAGTWQMRHIDGSAYNSNRETLYTLTNTLAREPFDLSKDHMLRIYLITLTPKEYVMVLSMHHVAADGWSLSVIIRELVELFNAYVSKRTPSLVAPSLQYADYAIWQHQHLTSELLEERTGYWKKQLQGIQPLELPTDFERPAVSSNRGAMTVFHIDKALATRLQQLSREQDCTLYMLLLAVFKVLLYRYSSQEDIAVGSVIAGRMQAETESLVGFFVNTLVMRSHPGSNPAFSEFLQEVRRTALDAYEHQDVPFESVVETVAGERDVNKNPLFQVMFALQNMPDMPEMKLGPVRLNNMALDHQISLFDMFWAVSERPDHIEVAVEYSTALFTEATIRRMAQHYHTLLHAAVDNIDLPLREMNMLDPEEKAQLFLKFNGTRHQYPAGKTVVELFEAQAAATPEAIAVTGEGHPLTYQALDQQANRIAHYLIANGVKPGDRVGLIAHRSTGMIAAIWGILKSGAAYVPFHTGYPAARMTMMMEDAGIKVILYTNQQLYDKTGLSAGTGLHMQGAAEYPAVSPGIRSSSEDVVNVMYTSGTTGRPKGIAISHQNITKLVFEPGVIAIRPDDRVLQWSNYSFDGSSYDIFCTLLLGAQLFMVPESAAADALELSAIMQAEKITVCFMTTALFNTFVDSSINGLAGLRKILFGGEKVSLTHVRKALSTLGTGKIVHVYGPTETTVYATAYPIDHIPEGAATIPIGRPLANTAVRILDINGHPVPAGIDGELYIGGDGVSLGYINNESLSSEKFVTLPGSTGRWYRTGDLGRWLADGNIAYTARVDDQVKIRGYRIEPGEIERVMNQLEEVSAACVVVKQHASGDKRLTAYYVPGTAALQAAAATGEDWNTATALLQKRIRTALQQRLPDYMMPSALIALLQLPLTPNGKADRKLLAARADAQPAEQVSEPVTAGTPLEQQLAAIWQRLLGVEHVGMQDSFFSLGGHSLLATRVVSAIRNELNTELAVRDLFLNPTVEKLAAHLRQQQTGLQLPAITVAERPEYIPLSYSQQRLWFIDQLEGSVQYNMPASFSLHGPLDVAALQQTWQHIVNRHEVLRSVIVQKGETTYQRVLSKDSWQMSIISDPVYKNDPLAVQALTDELIRTPFDLSRDHMLRVYLITLGAENHHMVLCMHHVAADGWSLSVLVSELVELYSAFVAKRQPALVPLAIQYADFAIWQRTHLTPERLNEHIGYWKKQLSGVPTLQLPTDFERPAVNSTEGAIIVFNIDQTLTECLHQLAREQDCTLYMLLLAVFKVLMFRYSGQEDIAVGSGIANRKQVETENLIGFFVNTLVMRSQISGNPVFTDFLQQVRRTALDAYEHQDVPFESVVDAMMDERDVSKNPLFQVMFALQNIPEIPELRLGEVSLRNVPLEHKTSLFDLFWSVSERPDNIEVAIEYSTDLFTEDTVRRMMQHYTMLLQSVVGNIKQLLSEINMLNTEEKARLFQQFNGVQHHYPADKTVVELFETQAAATPDAIAVSGEGDALTYQALDQQANQIAHYLVANGVKPGDRVGLLAHRSTGMIAAIWGVLKSGAAYVPFHTDFPAARITMMMEDAGINRLLYTDQQLFDKTGLPAAVGLSVQGAAEYPGEPTGIRTTSNDVVNVMYTSGTTGRPKGIVVSHQNITKLVYEPGVIAIRPDDRVLQWSNYSFDGSSYDIFCTLLQGARLCMVPDSTAADALELSAIMQAEKITVCFMTTALFNAFVDSSIHGLTGLRKILFGGEKVSLTHVRKALDVLGTDKMVHVYGPTETTVYATSYPINHIPEGAATIPIGRPLANTTIRILDTNGYPVPTGIDGELYIGGDGVSLGYINNASLSAEKFVTLPDSTGRWYRTGDLGRWQPDGNITYTSRVDNQVKIRGYRIEPGEIEKVMNQLEEINTSCVVVKQRAGGEKRLAGYYVPDPANVLIREQEMYRHHIENWKELYKVTFSKPEDMEIEDPEFDITGWNDSFTGGPIPADQMREWLQDIAGRIQVLKPRRVLEIGCGTGLIYYQLAAHIERYIGTDFSPVSTGQLQHHISKQLRPYPETTLHVCAAHELDLDPSENIDFVILNSVVQYFPGAQYLTDVVTSAMRMLNGKGHIVIGDVRDLRLLPAFRRRLLLDKLQEHADLKDFIWNTDQEVLREEELCFSPAYFYQLRQRFPEITHVDIQWKQGDYSNELTLYRYTVVLYVGMDTPVLQPQWQQWNQDTILTPGADTIALKGVPNPRLWIERQMAAALQNKEVQQVRDLMSRLAAPDATAQAVSTLLANAKSQGYQARFLPEEDPFTMSVVLERVPFNGPVATPYADKQHTGAAIANIPLFPDICVLLQKDIQQQLRERLPEYMVPAELTALQYIPLNSNGKSDRRFLAEWEDAQQQRLADYQPPVTPEEIQLAEIWQRLLGVERIGIADNFFALGGHSLLATRVVSAIRKQLDVQLTVKDFFVYPTIAALAAYLQGREGEWTLPVISVMPRPEQLPLSFGQERLWFIDRLQGSVQYHMNATLRLKGNLNKAALQAALETIVDRHEATRTVIRTDELTGAGYQHILASGQWQLSLMDTPEDLQTAITEVIAHPFDLTADHMLRACLISVHETEYVLVLTIHHIASDGWSMSNLIKELIILYRAFATHTTPDIQPLPLQYADYALWQRKYLTGEVLQTQLAYWKKQLEDSTQLNLPTDFERPATQSSRGAAIQFNISKTLTDKLNALSQQEGVTLYMTLLAAFKVLLYRYSGQEDIVLGSGVAGRTHEETEAMIGFFVNTLVMRSRINREDAFNSFLQQVKEVTLNAYAHQDVPFEKIVEAVVEKRDISVNPLFQVVFLLQNAPKMPAFDLAGVTLTDEPSAHATSQFDMSWFLTENEDGLRLDIEYCTDLFKAATIHRLLHYYQLLLQAIAANPQEKIAGLELMTAAEKQQLLLEFNNNKREDASRTAVDLFNHWVATTPDATALIFGEKQLTYRQLDEQAGQLARYLNNAGVGTDTLVPVCIPRSLELIIAIMGILKAGGAYVPVDTEYPAERMAYMLEDTAASLVITTSAIRSKMPLNDQHTVIEIDNPTADWQQQPVTPYSNSSLTPGHLAYLIYTSGSTGKPKGVMVEHKGVVNMAIGIREAMQLQPGMKNLQFASIGFDAASAEIFSTLLGGACLVMADKELLLSGVTLEALINKYEVAVLTCPPSYLYAMKDSLGSLKTVVSAGEALNSSLAIEVQAKGIRLINAYGPTEGTVCASLTGVPVNEDNMVVIGHPLTNVPLYVLDESLQLVPTGGVGELCIGGIQVARGYLNLPTLTAERFINNPFAPGDRLYKTGDLVRWLPDGNLVYLGRKDEQVKIRGHRIELGEVESALNNLQEVAACCVVIKHQGHNSRLAAYVVPASNTVTVLEIKAHLQERLPDYMVPADFISLPELPVTSSGKIDRKYLSALEDTFSSDGTPYQAPATIMERHLATIWQELLGVSRVGVHDNFFDLGGDSIITIQLVNRAKYYGYDLHPKHLFKHQTIAELVTVLTAEANKRIHGEQGYLTGECGLLPVQQWYLGDESNVSDHMIQTVPVVIKKSVSTEDLKKAIHYIVSFHDSLRFAYGQKDGNWHQWYGHDNGTVEVIDLRHVPADRLNREIAMYEHKYNHSLSMREGKLVIAMFFLTPDFVEENRLTITIHHLGVDVVSWRILLDNLDYLLEALQEGREMSLGAKSSSYREWYNTLCRYSESNRLLSQRDYWLETMEQYVPLRTDKQYEGLVKISDMPAYRVRLDAHTTRLLMVETSLAYRTDVKDLLLSALALTLSEWMGTAKVSVGFEKHGREDIAADVDISHTTGWFTSLFPVLLDAGAGHDTGTLIRTVKEQLGQVPDKGIGFGVMKYINREPALQGKDPWDIIFNFHGQLDNISNSHKWIAVTNQQEELKMIGDYTMRFKLFVDCSITENELVIDWLHSVHHFEHATIKSMGEAFIRHLTTLIRHCVDKVNERQLYTV